MRENNIFRSSMELLDLDDATLGAIISFARDPYDMLGAAMTCRRLRDVARRVRELRWPGWKVRRMTPQRKWKYAAVRRLDEQATEAIDEGARDLMCYCGSRASFDECWSAWQKSFRVWHHQPNIKDGLEELRMIQSIIRGDRSAIESIICEGKHCANDRIAQALGKYADEDIIRSAVISAKGEEHDDALEIIVGAIRAKRVALADELIEYVRENWDDVGDALEHLSRGALRAGDMKLFKKINGDYREKMNVSLADCAARCGDVKVFAESRKWFQDWDENIADIHESAVRSGNVAMVHEVCAKYEMASLKSQSRGGCKISQLDVDFRLAGYSDWLVCSLARIAAIQGNRAMCDYVLTWSRATETFNKVCKTMMVYAIKYDRYWIRDIVLHHFAAVHGPRATLTCAEPLRACCALIARSIHHESA